MATPWRCFEVLLRWSQTPIHIPLFSCACVFVSLRICVCCGCLCVGSALPCYMLGSQDVSIDCFSTGQCPPRPSLLQCQKCQLQPVPSTSSSLRERRYLFMVCLSHRACLWCPRHKEGTELNGGPHGSTQTSLSIFDVDSVVHGYVLPPISIAHSF